MKFEEAFKLVLNENKKIRRNSWAHDLCINDVVIMMSMGIYDEIKNSNDWEIIE